MNEALRPLRVWAVSAWSKTDEVGVETGEGEDNGGSGSGRLEYLLGLFEEPLGLNRPAVA